MKIKSGSLVIAGMLMLSGVAQANGKVIRATEMASVNWSDLSTAKLGDFVVEFRQGDEIPLSFHAEGDLIETRQNSVSTVVVKKNFWIRLSSNLIEISFDGTNFKKIQEAVSGSIEAGAGSAQNGGFADAINVVFKTIRRTYENGYWCDVIGCDAVDVGVRGPRKL